MLAIPETTHNTTILLSCARSNIHLRVLVVQLQLFFILLFGKPKDQEVDTLGVPHAFGSRGFEYFDGWWLLVCSSKDLHHGR